MFSDLTWSHLSTHTSSKPYTHPWVGKFLQISNLQIESNYLDWFECFWIFTDYRGPPGWVDWDGGGVGLVVGGAPCTHAHAHTCTHICTCMLNMINIDASMGAAICNFYTCKHVCACMCMCAHACACVGGTPIPHTPIHAPPSPRVARSPKHQNSINLELIKIIQFCLKILYLWTLLNSYRI